MVMYFSAHMAWILETSCTYDTWAKEGQLNPLKYSLEEFFAPQHMENTSLLALDRTFTAPSLYLAISFCLG